MDLYEEQKALLATLVEVMNDINGLLKAEGDDLIRYQGLQKIKNIAKNNDPHGVGKLPTYLVGLEHVIMDNRLLTMPIKRKLEQAQSILLKIERLSED